MSTDQYKQIAQRLGFERTGKAANKFILFDDDTDGRNGRTIYIDLDLLTKFEGTSKRAKEELLYVFYRIKQLKSLAGGLSSHFDPADPKSRVNFFGKAEVTYTIRQHTDASGLPAGVYITGIDLARFEDREPGLYLVKETEGNFELTGTRIDKIKTTRAAINGLCEDAEQTASRIMPTMIDHAYGHQKWLQQSGVIPKDNSYTLFFNPPEMYKNGKKITSQSAAINQRLTARRLGLAMIEAQSRKQKVQWAIHGDGIYTFSEALKLLGTRDLSCHTAMFYAPNKDVTSVLPLMKNSNMEIHDEVYKTHDSDFISKQAQSGNGAELEKQLLSMGKNESLAAVKRIEANDYVWKQGAFIFGTTSAAVTAIAAAIINPATLIPTVTIGPALLFAAKSYYDKTQGARNTATGLAGSTNAETNPHLNPTLSKVALNQQANTHYKQQSISFVKRVLQRLV